MNNPAPQDFGTISPFIMVDDIDQQIDFLKSVFNAEVKGNLKNAEGLSVHAEVIIGSSVIMLGRGSRDLPSQPSMNYVFVTDANSVYKKAWNWEPSQYMNRTISFMESEKRALRIP